MLRSTLLAIAIVIASQAAQAQDHTGNMLRRALEKRLPTPGDREVAAELLSDWRNLKPDDPALQRAFQNISQGSPPTEEQMPALLRTYGHYAVARAEAEARVAQSAGGLPGNQPRGVRNRSRPDTPRRNLPSGLVGNVLAVGGIAAAVFAGGVIWVIAARKRWVR